MPHLTARQRVSGFRASYSATKWHVSSHVAAAVTAIQAALETLDLWWTQRGAILAEKLAAFLISLVSSSLCLMQLFGAAQNVLPSSEWCVGQVLTVLIRAETYRSHC